MIRQKPELTLFAMLLLFYVTSARAGVDPGLFDTGAMVKAPGIVSCTLDNGASSECVEFVVKYKPDDLETGPYCPDTLSDTGGVWAWDGEEAGLYRLDGEFFAMLSELGLDFSDDGEHINISDPGAGRPDSDHACLEASEQPAVQVTLRIPVSPAMADSKTDLGTVAKVGLALDGVPVFADAPSVLDTGHLPALDVCGGHIDPGGWYHWHATSTDVESVFDDQNVDADCGLLQSASTLFAFAFDGYAMYGHEDIDGSIPGDLDECNGHVGVTEQSPEGEYHYHSTSQFPNLPPCLSGVQAQDNFSTTSAMGIGSANVGAGGPGGGGGRGRPDTAAMAESLGVTEAALIQAIAAAGGPGPQTDLPSAATALGVTLDELQEALPGPPGR